MLFEKLIDLAEAGDLQLGELAGGAVVLRRYQDKSEVCRFPDAASFLQLVGMSTMDGFGARMAAERQRIAEQPKIAAERAKLDAERLADAQARPITQRMAQALWATRETGSANNIVHRRTGGAFSRMVDELHDRGLVERHGSGITAAGRAKLAAFEAGHPKTMLRPPLYANAYRKLVERGVVTP